MNKTVTINISGIIFHIEEDAYETLSKYIAAIKSSFSNTEGGAEILADIEARIAELLQSKTSASKQVIVMDDVQMVIETMGNPEQFSDGETQNNSRQTNRNEQSQSFEKVKRRLFRDPDDKAIGGVCSGLAAYFDVDTVWVRLAMFLLVFFGGLSLWVYFILWIVMPEARTTADKFAMRGEPANINTIFKNFKEEAEDVKNRAQKFGREYRDSGYTNSVRDNIVSFLRTMFDIAGRLIGLLLVLVGGLLLFLYAASVMGIPLDNNNQSLTNWKQVLFSSSSDYALAAFAFVIVLGIPIAMLVYGGIKLLFRIKYNNRWINVSLGILWSIGFAVGIYVIAITAREFNEGSRIKETVMLHGVGDTIVVRMDKNLMKQSLMQFENADDLEHELEKSHRGILFGHNDKNINIVGFAELNIVYSESDSVELSITRLANGRTKRDANNNARAIQYRYSQEGNTLNFDKGFVVSGDAMYRDQELELVLRVPAGKVVKLEQSIADLLDNVENTTNTWDGDMAGRRWKMTSQGLECIDCENLKDVKSRKHKNKEDDITIDHRGIHVSSDETDIKIDEDGIKIHTPEKDVHIGDKQNARKKGQETQDENGDDN